MSKVTIRISKWANTHLGLQRVAVSSGFKVSALLAPHEARDLADRLNRLADELGKQKGAKNA